MMALILSFPLSALSLGIVYLWVLAIAAGLADRGEHFSRGPASRIAVVVPAHDEESGLAGTLASLRDLDYPQELFEVVVVADNCGDATAEVARTSGVRCLERFDASRRGKGHALAYAFDVLLPEGWDAIAVVDADNTVSANFLRVMDGRLRCGQDVIQSRNTVRNPLENALTWMLAVGNAMENDLYCAGKASLGLSCPLRGTGMCFSGEILRALPWGAGSVAEDTEYGLELAEKGRTVFFAGVAEVSSDAPATLQMLSAQRIRWASGNMDLARRKALRFMAEGIARADVRLADAGWSMLIRSKPLLLTVSLLIFFASVATGTLTAWSSSVLTLWFAYLAAGIRLAGISGRSAKLTLLAPFHLAWLVGFAVLGLVRFRGRQWVRTGRRQP